jgi:hypothetical protein
VTAIRTPEHTDELRSTISQIVTEELGGERAPQPQIVELLVKYFEITDFHVEDLLHDREDGESYVMDYYDVLETLARECVIS